MKPQSGYPFRFGHLPWLLLVCLLLAGGTAGAQELQPPLDTALREALAPPPPDEGESPYNWEELRGFYAGEDYRPVWLGAAGPNRRAALLRRRLLEADREGLVPQHYRTELIEPLWNSTYPIDRLRLELLLSSAFFDYARDLRRGRFDPQQVAQLWKINRMPVDPLILLRVSLHFNDFGAALDLLPPVHPVYNRLRQALAHYRRIEALGGWPTIPPGPTLRLGSREPRVAMLRGRLQREGELSLPAAAEDLFDEGLAYAVERFQVRHSLDVDGVVGGKTLAALNVPVAERIEQILLNMERWRWLPHSLGRHYLLVNIPAFELIVYEEDEARVSMPVIVGTRERPTPMLSGLLHTLVLNPDWTVPRNIALRDVLPRQRRNPDYLPSQGIRVFSNWQGEEELDPQTIDWDAVNWNHYPYMLRQDPGPKNALGRVKFLFNNPFSIYLHDTPHEGLFAESSRAYSSGCVRLEEPFRLLEFLLGEEKGWAGEKDMLQAVLDTGLIYEVPLAAPTRLYLLYFTVWVGEDGVVHFSEDIYGEDALLALLMPPREQSH
jgi:murein L,D-transpeptidase YcbB/YkuD